MDILIERKVIGILSDDLSIHAFTEKCVHVTSKEVRERYDRPVAYIESRKVRGQI